MILYIGIFFIGVVIGWKLRELHALYFLKKILTDKTLENGPKIETPPLKQVNMKIEKIGDVFYLYNNDTGEFLGQGKSKDELTPILQQRFPGHSFTAFRENIEEVDFK